MAINLRAITSVDAVNAVRVLARMARVLERSTDELSLANYRVLSAIGAGESSASRVGARLALGKPTVSATVESLCARGLVSRAPAERDHRAISLRLTHDGSALLEQVEA
jgi:DNA-binding MarR family transcriptional regulator